MGWNQHQGGLVLLVFDVLVVCALAGAWGEDSLLTRLETTSGTCGVVPLRLTIHPPARHRARCEAAPVTTFGCRGQCSSYVKASYENPSEITRLCKCCEPTLYGVHMASLPCWDGTQLRMILKFAMECICRPCVQNMARSSLDIEDALTDDPMMIQGRLVRSWVQND